MPSYTNTFPLPPPLSALTNNVYKRGRVPSKRYVAWKKLVTPYAYFTPRIELSGDVVAVYAIGKPSKARMDLDNRSKAIGDLMTEWAIITDDSNIVDLRLYWDPTVPKGMVRVTLTAVESCEGL